jgi:response regulator RpfG family c-di-GMP phosphodiesterase
MIEQAGMTCKMVSSAEEALNVLKTEPVDAVITDLIMPRVSGLDLLKEVRRLYPRLVFLIATGAEDVRLGVQAMRQGADDYLTKPLQLDEVTVSLERAFEKKRLEYEVENYRQNLEHFVSERTVQLQEALERVGKSYADVLDALGAAIDLRDDQTAGHSRRVVLYSVEILRQMEGTTQQLKNLAMGAWLHDIGKLAVPDAILRKPGPLTDEERRIIQGHALIGYNWVKRIPFLTDAAELILTHHERWNGTGYPRGLKGVEIPLVSRVFAVADTIDAMMSDRPYRSALSAQDAWEEIDRQSGIHFDPQVARVFLKIPRKTWTTIREHSSAMQISAIFSGTDAEANWGLQDLAGAPSEQYGFQS